MRFERNYQLTIVAEGGRAVVIEPPINIVFSVEKNTDSDLNKATIEVYNLRESNRLSLVRDSDDSFRLPVVLKVGYGDTLQTIFQGSVHRGTNKREGADFISRLECLDGGDDYLNSFTSRSVRGRDTILDVVLQDMANTGRGTITPRTAIKRPRILFGNSAEILRETLDPDEEMFIDNEQMNIVRKKQAKAGYVPVASASTGLTNTPEREEKRVTFDTILNPSIVLAGQVSIDSETAPHLNDVYKVVALSHQGEYDGAVWTQTVTGEVIPDIEVI